MKPVVILDTCVLSDEKLMARLNHKGINLENSTFSTISLVELIGFNWVDFLKSNGIENLLISTYSNLEALDICDDSSRCHAKNLLKEYLASITSKKMLSQFTEAISHKSRKGDNISKCCSALLNEPANAISTLSLLSTQSLFMPTTASIQIKKATSGHIDQWKQFFFGLSLLSKLQESDHLYSSLWPACVERTLGRGQALDIQIYDWVFFGLGTSAKKTGVSVFTKESFDKTKNQLSYLAGKLARGIASYLRKNMELSTLPLLFGNIICLDGQLEHRINIRDTFDDAIKIAMSADQSDRNHL